MGIELIILGVAFILAGIATIFVLGIKRKNSLALTSNNVPKWILFSILSILGIVILVYGITQLV